MMILDRLSPRMQSAAHRMEQLCPRRGAIEGPITSVHLESLEWGNAQREKKKKGYCGKNHIVVLS